MVDKFIYNFDNGKGISGLSLDLVRPHVERINAGSSPPLGLFAIGTFQVNTAPVRLIDLRLHPLAGSELQNQLTGQVTGISIQSTAEIIPALRVAEAAKASGKLVVLGGPTVTLNSEWFLQQPMVDVVIPGAGERSMAELLQDSKNSRQPRGLYMSSQPNQPTVPNDIYTQLAANDPQLLARYLRGDTYRWGKTDITEAHMLSSIGCPFGCDYCTPSRAWNQKVHYPTTPEKFVNDIILTSQLRGPNLPINMINIRDENFVINPKRAEEILRLILRAKKDGRLPRQLSFRFKARFESLTPRFLDLCQEAGVVQISGGIENPTDLGLKQIGRHGKSSGHQELFETFRLMLQRGIGVHALLIWGGPNETTSMLKQYVEFGHHLAESFPLSPDAEPQKSVTIFMNFWTPHPVNGKYPLTPPDQWRLLENDPRVFDHVTPVGMSPLLKIDDFVKAYDSFVEVTQSGRFNPPIPAAFIQAARSSKSHLNNLPEYQELAYE